jgi:hypothetical protein
MYVMVLNGYSFDILFTMFFNIHHYDLNETLYQGVVDCTTDMIVMHGLKLLHHPRTHNH